MAGMSDVSEPDDLVSEHEELVSQVSTIESSGAGVDVFLCVEGSEKGLAKPMERKKHIPVQEVELTYSFLYQL